MDWFHWVMLAFGIFYVVLVPVVFMKAIRRKEWQHLFELAVMTFWVFGLVLDTVSPATVHDAWHPLLWLWLLSSLLFLANAFGFSGWLFNRYLGTRQI